MWAKKQKNHDGLSASKISSFRVKFSLFIAEFSGDLCKQDCSLNGIAFIQIAPTFLMLSEFTPCPNPPQSTITPFLSLVSSMPSGRNSSIAYRSSLMEAECRAQFIRKHKSEMGNPVISHMNR